MEEKEASTTSNAASPGRKAYVLGVVNASEIKCKVDRKRRWDQPPDEDGPPCKTPCSGTSESMDPLLENNIRHCDDSLIGNDVDVSIPPPSKDEDYRLSSPPSPSQPIVVKEQIFVQTSSDVLNTLDLNSTFPNTLAGSFNEFNYTEGNQRVTIEIETVAVTPSSSDDEIKTSVEIVDPNSSTIDSLPAKDNKDPKVKGDEVDTNTDDVSSPPDSEGGFIVNRSIIEADLPGRVDPDVMEVIIGISPASNVSVPQSTQRTESQRTAEKDSDGDNKINEKPVDDERAKTSNESSVKDEETESENRPVLDNSTKSEAQLTKVGVKLKALVDYDDYSDESSQQSDKVTHIESASKLRVDEVSTVCENSLDSKEEEFHDCLEQPTTDESNFESTSLNNIVPTSEDHDNPDPTSNPTEASLKQLPIVNENVVDTLVSNDSLPTGAASLNSEQKHDSSKDDSSCLNDDAITTEECADSSKLLLDDRICDNSQLMKESDNGGSCVATEVDDILVDKVGVRVDEPNKLGDFKSKDTGSKLLPNDLNSIIPLIEVKGIETISGYSSLSLVPEVTSHQISPFENKSEDSNTDIKTFRSDDCIDKNILDEEKFVVSSAEEEINVDKSLSQVQSYEGSVTDALSLEIRGDSKKSCSNVLECRSEIEEPASTPLGVEITSDTELKEPEKEIELIEPVIVGYSPEEAAKDHPSDSNKEVESFDKDVGASGHNEMSSTSTNVLIDTTKATEPPDNENAITNENEMPYIIPNMTENDLIPSKSNNSIDESNASVEASENALTDKSLEPLKESEVFLPETAKISYTHGKDSGSCEGDNAKGNSEIEIASSNSHSAISENESNVKDEKPVDAKAGEESPLLLTVQIPEKTDKPKETSVGSIDEAQNLSDLPEAEKSNNTVQNLVENVESTDRSLENVKIDDGNDIRSQKVETVESSLLDRTIPLKDVEEVKSTETVPFAVEGNKIEHSKSAENSSTTNINSNISLKRSETSDCVPVNEIISSDLEKVDDLNSKSKISFKEHSQSPLLITENNSVQSFVDLNMECESVQSMESIISHGESLSAIKGDSDLINSNSIIDISSDSNCSGKKDRMALSFNLQSINNNKKSSEVRTDKLDNKTFSLISSDDDNSSVSCVNSMTDLEIVPYSNRCKEKTNPVEGIEKVINTSSACTKIQPETISVPDSDSSNSKVECLAIHLTTKKENESLAVDSLSTSVDKASNKLVSNRVEKTGECVKNSAVRIARSKASTDVSFSTLNKKSEFPVSSKMESSAEPMEVCEDMDMLNNSNEEFRENLNNDSDGNQKNEPITLRIFKDNNALHSESRESPKRPRLDDSPKQLEFTLKISKDASTNIPKATMSPKRTQSPQRIPDPVFPRISSEVSITPVTNSPPKIDKKAIKRHSRQGRSRSPSPEPSIEISPSKSENRVPTIIPHVNSIPEIVKMDLNNCNSVNNSGESSIIGIKNEVPFSMGTPVNISVRGKRGRKEINPIPGPPRRRGRPPKRPVEIVRTLPLDGTYGEFGPDGIHGTHTDTPSGRPVRECRDRTKPILVKQRKPRGGGNSRGRGGRGGARIPLVPGREALSIREQEELARIEARNQQIRLEKLAKREAKLAKKAKKFGADFEDLGPPPPPPRELTEEEKIELAAKREAQRKAAAEAAAKAAIEAERLAAEAAAAKEAEKLAKVAARKERLRELHRMKREKMLAKKAAKKIKDEERRKRKAAEKAAEQAAALQSMYEDETRMSAPDGSLRPLYGDDTPNRNKTGRMEINLSESKEVSVEQLAEYQWDGGELYMIQEQVAEYLGVKSFKRKYPDLRRRPVDAEERKFLEDTCLVPKSLCDLGITAVSSAEVLDIMYQDFPDKYEEVRKYLREKQMREISSKQRALSLYSKQSDKAKADLREQAVECAATWNAHLNRERREERKCSMDLQSFIIHYPLSKRESMKQPAASSGNYPVAVLPGQFCDYYKRYTSNELMYFPMNTVLYGPLKPNERRIFQSDASQSESEESSSSSPSSSSSEESDSESEADEDTKCKICNASRTSQPDEGGGFTSPPPAPPTFNKPEIFLPCSKCKLLCHPSCCKITDVMLPHVRKYNWVCLACKFCSKCNTADNQSKMRLCDLCQRGFHITCLDARKMVPEGNRWHCAFCSFCWSCNAREPGGPSNQWLHEFIKDENGEKVYQRSLCATCCANVGREAAAAVAAAAVAAVSSGGPCRTAGSNIVTSSGTVFPGTSGLTPSSSIAAMPLKNYQLVQTKDGGQVRMAVSRSSLGSMVVRPGIGRGQDTSLMARCATTPGMPASVLVRPNTDTQVVIRTPTGVISRPPLRHNLIVSPNNRIEAIGSLSSGATNMPKK